MFESRSCKKDLHGNVVGPRAMRQLVLAVGANKRITKLSVPDAGPLLTVRQRRHHGTLERLLGKLVEANEEGATYREKAKVRNGFKRESKALRRKAARRRKRGKWVSRTNSGASGRGRRPM